MTIIRHSACYQSSQHPRMRLIGWLRPRLEENRWFRYGASKIIAYRIRMGMCLEISDRLTAAFYPRARVSF